MLGDRQITANFVKYRLIISLMSHTNPSSPASQPSKRKDHTQWIVLTSGTSTLTKSQVVGQIWMTPIFSDKLLLLLSKWCKTKEKDIPRIISSKNLFILIILRVFLKEIPIQHSGMLFWNSKVFVPPKQKSEF